MNRLTLGTVAPTISRVLRLCATDVASIADYVNRAQERLLNPVHSVGTYGRYRVCINEACITLPRELENIEVAAICDAPASIRSEWYEFLESGPGLVTTDSDVGLQIVDRGEACAFDDVTGTGKKLAVYCDKTEDLGAVINLQYYDGSGQWVRTSYNGAWIDGENVALEKGTYNYTMSTVAATGFIRAIKPVTNGMVRIYEYTASTGIYKPLAYYQPSETIPVYRRYMIPNLDNECSCGTTSTCDSKAVTVVGKLRMVPALTFNDFLIISSSEAIRLMCQAIHKEENNLMAGEDGAVVYEAKAFKVLDDQYRHYKGSGEQQPMAFLSSDVTGPGVLNLV